MHPATGWCSGCHRTLDEIASWSTMSDADKQRVWDLLPLRDAVHPSNTPENANEPSEAHPPVMRA